ncbi:MAG: hypothetical protein LBV06_05300 [Propionibacteriaceae bacterium]|nr:hypothetical protein [Propionibacteriaceae bacterium]
MSPDPEAAWPLTSTGTGYYPSAPTASTPASAPLTPLPPSMPPAAYQPISNHSLKSMSPGMRLGYLATILGCAIPLTAIAASMMGFTGVIVSWVGIVFVTAITMNQK